MTIQELLKKITEKQQFKYQGFLRGVLSNSHPISFEKDGKWCCSEHYFLAKKAEVFQDNYTYQEILKTRDPLRLRKLGRQVRNFNPEVWGKIKESVMYSANLYKFRQHEPDRNALLKTGDDVLVWCNSADREWGAGIAPDDPRLNDPFSWPGENKLGFVLMQVRETLRDEASNKSKTE